MSAELKNLYAPAPFTERGKAVHLGVGPKNDDLVFCTGNNVFYRSLKDFTKCEDYSEHQHQTTVARYSPSGFYIASGDSAGKVRIWATDNEEKTLKIELPVLGGPIRDMAWSEDSKRIVVCGEGNDVMARVFLFDSGSSVGEISGHKKFISSCDFKQTRPFRIVTGSEDFSVNWFEGPPFKFKESKKDHTRFVNCVRFSPDGSKFLTVGSDKKGFFYDGKTGESLGYELNGDVHKAGIYSVAWSADSKQVATCSADKTVKVWNAEDGTCLNTFSPAGDKPAVEDMQVGVVWHNGQLVSLSLSGALNFHDFDNPNAPKVQLGHNKFVKALAYDAANNRAFTGDYEARMLSWDLETGSNKGFSGKGHGNQINSIRIAGEKVVTGAMDDSVRITPTAGNYDEGSSISCDGAVADVATNADASLIVAAARNEVALIRNGSKVGSVAADWQPTSVALSSDGSMCAVGGQDKLIRLYTVGENSLTETKQLKGHKGSVNAVKFSKDDKTLAGACNGNYVILFDVEAGTGGQEWPFHTAAVKDVSWSPDNLHLATAGLDGVIFVYSVEEPAKRIKVLNAHKGGVNAIEWVNDVTLVSVGEDCAMRTWSVTKH